MKKTILFTLLSSSAIGASLNAITYEHFENEKISAHILTVDPKEEKIEIFNCNGVDTVSNIAKKNGSIAAINGGFYGYGDHLGKPKGILQINGNRLSETDRSRGAFGFDKEMRVVLIDRLDSSETNRLLPLFHPENESNWNELENILGSTPLLLVDGKKPEDYNDEKVAESFLNEKFSRSAVGILEDGKILFVMVEGMENGMTIEELADFMKERGCLSALNLCGGHSSALYYRGDLFHSSHLRDDESEDETIFKEKPVGNMLLITEKDEI